VTATRLVTNLDDSAGDRKDEFRRLGWLIIAAVLALRVAPVKTSPTLLFHVSSRLHHW